MGSVFPSQSDHSLDLASINSKSIFVPVLPLFESSPSSNSKIPPAFMNSFLAEQQRTLEEKRAANAKVFPDNNKMITVREANLLVAVMHANNISEAYSEGVGYIENMLYKQFVAAIGKEVTPVDFANYLTFHYRKIYAQQYRPQPFSYAVRRPEHSPEVSIFKSFESYLFFIVGNFVYQCTSCWWKDLFPYFNHCFTQHRYSPDVFQYQRVYSRFVFRR